MACNQCFCGRDGGIRTHDLFVDWEDIADNTVAILRGAAGRNPYDKALSNLVGELSTRSDDFRSPIVRGMARQKKSEQARSRILNDDELRSVWRAAACMEGPFGYYVRFLLLTAARRND